MSITPAVQAQVTSLTTKTSSIGAQMMSPDSIAKMFQLLAKFQANPALFDEFKKTPEAVVSREVGDLGPPGTHFHTADENNNYIPPEFGAADQIMKGMADPETPWVRVEIRAGIGPLCFFNCGICDNTTK